MSVKVTTFTSEGISWTKMVDDKGRLSLSCDTHTAHKSDDGRRSFITIARRGQDNRPGRSLGTCSKLSEAIDIILKDKKSPCS